MIEYENNQNRNNPSSPRCKRNALRIVIFLCVFSGVSYYCLYRLRPDLFGFATVVVDDDGLNESIENRNSNKNNDDDRKYDDERGSLDHTESESDDDDDNFIMEYSSNFCEFKRILQSQTHNKHNNKGEIVCDGLLTPSHSSQERRLYSSEFICSPDENFFFGLSSSSGNEIVICENDYKVWSIGPFIGYHEMYLNFQKDGNLVLYGEYYEETTSTTSTTTITTNKKSLWKSGTDGYDRAWLQLFDSGVLQIINYGSVVLWEAKPKLTSPEYPSVAPSTFNSTLLSSILSQVVISSSSQENNYNNNNKSKDFCEFYERYLSSSSSSYDCPNFLFSGQKSQRIYPSQFICSENKEFFFGLTTSSSEQQSSSHHPKLALCYQNTTVWSVGPWENISSPYVSFQTDSNLVVYTTTSSSSTSSVWASDTDGHKNSILLLENNGLLQIKNIMNGVLWSIEPTTNGGAFSQSPSISVSPTITLSPTSPTNAPTDYDDYCELELIAKEEHYPCYGFLSVKMTSTRRTLRINELICSPNREYFFGISPAVSPQQHDTNNNNNNNMEEETTTTTKVSDIMLSTTSSSSNYPYHIVICHHDKKVQKMGPFYGLHPSLYFQSDGKLVLKDESPNFQINTRFESNDGGEILELQNDGLVVIKSESGEVLWQFGDDVVPSSSSSHHQSPLTTNKTTPTPTPLYTNQTNTTTSIVVSSLENNGILSSEESYNYYYPGELEYNAELDLYLSAGLEGRLIALTDEFVPYHYNTEYSNTRNPTSADADSTTIDMMLRGGKFRNNVHSSSSSSSSIRFHDRPDAAACFSSSDGSGWYYLSNSEVGDEYDSKGGVGRITFDSSGNVIDYKMVLNGTRMNCGSGKTPWNTFISCEEFDSGHCWEVDPQDKITPRETRFGGIEGDVFESVAFDSRRRRKRNEDAVDDNDDERIMIPYFYDFRGFATVDKKNGALHRFTPDPEILQDALETGNYRNVLHIGGVQDYLELIPESRTFRWTSNKSVGEKSAQENYPHTEGIDVHEGSLYFVSKTNKMLFILDLDEMTYTSSSTMSGTFNGQPDQIVRLIQEEQQHHDVKDGNHTNKSIHQDHDTTTSQQESLLYFLEDGGPNGQPAGVYARDANGFYTIVEGGLTNSDETTGLAFCDDGKRMMFAFQSEGKLFEIKRRDGKPFYGNNIDVKYHGNKFRRRKRN